MARYGSSYSYQFGPGPLSPAVKVLLFINVAAWLLNLLVPAMTLRLGLSPKDVFTGFAFWQPFTYMFLHAAGARASSPSTTSSPAWAPRSARC